MIGFPTSKIELHQWANSILLVIVGFIVQQTYVTIQADHEKLAQHETKIAVNTQQIQQHESAISDLNGRLGTIRNNVNRGHQLSEQD